MFTSLPIPAGHDRKMKRKNPSGISAVVILGIIAVLLTIVVPLISRTVVDLRISRQQEEQARAFSVAESGLERVLIGGADSGTIDQIDYTVTSDLLGDSGSDDAYNYPQYIDQDGMATIWLVSHEDSAGFDPDAHWTTKAEPRFSGNSLTVYWGTYRTNAHGDEEYTEEQSPALEASLIYKDGSEYKVERYLFDPASGRVGTGGFVPVAINTGGTLVSADVTRNYAFSGSLLTPCAAPNICFLLRIRLLYTAGESHPVGVVPLGDLPKQGECYDSSARTESGISSRVQRCILYKDAPPIFDFAMYSGTDLDKTAP